MTDLIRLCLSHAHARERLMRSTIRENETENVVIGPFIDGLIVESQDTGRVDVTNPSDGKKCLTIPAGSDTDVNRAVESARRAFHDGRWSGAAPSFKKSALIRFAELIERNADRLDVLDAVEMGKPVGERFGSATSAAGLVRFYAEAVDKIRGDVFSSDARAFVAQRQVPRGVVAAVVPWNFPTAVAVLKIAPALAAGNTVVLKPSELASRSSMLLAELAVQAGVPKGVLNVVPGLGETVGRALGLHKDVDMIAFTGSTSVGKLMLQYSGQSNMKVVQAECGGKSPHIVFGECDDIDLVSDAIAKSLLVNQGQVCSVGSRLLVHRSIENRVLERIARRFSQIVIGDALDKNTTFGPLVSATQCERVLRHIDTAKTEGAKLVVGGRRVRKESGGFFVEPTLLSGVSPAARISQEEVFGPVLASICFDSEEEMVNIANGTMYGLSAYVWTSNMSIGMRVANRLSSSVRLNAALPMGEGPGYAASSEPYKQSGIGVEGGIAGMETYMRRKRIWINHA